MSVLELADTELESADYSADSNAAPKRIGVWACAFMGSVHIKDEARKVKCLESVMLILTDSERPL